MNQTTSIVVVRSIESKTARFLILMSCGDMSHEHPQYSLYRHHVFVHFYRLFDAFRIINIITWLTYVTTSMEYCVVSCICSANGYFPTLHVRTYKLIYKFTSSTRDVQSFLCNSLFHLH